MKDIKHTKEGAVSHITAYPPIAYLFAIVFGLISDNVINFRVGLYEEPWAETLGIIFLVLASLLIVWAQYSSQTTFKTKHVIDVKEEDFHKGPYHFIRHPTYLGLFCLCLGFGLLAYSFSVIVLSFAAFFVINYYIVPHEEEILLSKYGEEYKSYRERTKRYI